MCGARRFVAVFVCVGLARMSPSPSGFCTFAHGSCTGPCTFARRLLHICPWALHICPPASAPASALLPTALAPSLAHLPAGPCTFARRLLHRTWPEVTPRLSTIYRERFV